MKKGEIACEQSHPFFFIVKIRDRLCGKEQIKKNCHISDSSCKFYAINPMCMASMQRGEHV